MKNGDKRRFSDKKKLKEMLDFCLYGFSDSQIARHYKCDVSSIRHQRDLNNTIPYKRPNYILQRKLSKILGCNYKKKNRPKKKLKYANIVAPKLCTGKMFADYVVESCTRETRKTAQAAEERLKLIE